MPFSQPNAPDTFRRILARNVTLPLAIGVGSALLFIALIAYLIDAQNWVEHSDEVISRAYAAETADLELETGLRGFLLAGESRFLEGFDGALVDVRASVENLKSLVAEDREQLERLNRIEALQARWNAYARERIARKRADPNSTSARRPARASRSRTQCARSSRTSSRRSAGCARTAPRRPIATPGPR